ncbi:hypothetical protein M2103_002234 [Ereboglobus sp. PH5-5]|nr:hypothetical protein [Ereboglobus sp. PH5-5]
MGLLFLLSRMHTFRKSGLAVLRSPAVILLLLTFVFFADLFLTGKTFLLRDGFFLIIKADLYGLQTLADGSFPFWDTQGAGKPYMENPGTGFFYPLSLVFSMFSVGWAINLFCLLNVWLLGLGVYFFTRQMQIGRTPSMVAAISIMFSTFTMAYLEFLIALAAMPWIFFILGVLGRFYHIAKEEGGRTTGTISLLWRHRGLMVALTFLFVLSYCASYHEFFAYPFLGYLLFIILTAAIEKSWRLLLSMSLFCGIGGFIAMLIVVPQLGLMWSFLPFTERAMSFDARFDMASLSGAHLLKAIFPMIGGRPGFPDVYWSPGTYEFCIGTFYTGALALLALPFAFLSRWRERSRAERVLLIWGVILAAFGLIISLGDNTPIYPLMWKYVPMMNKLRFASKFLLLVLMGEVALVGLGVQYILKNRKPLEKRAVLVLCAEALLAGLAVILLVYVIMDPSRMPALFNYKGAPVPDEKLAAVLPSLRWSCAFLVLALGWIIWTLWRGASRATPLIAIGLAAINLIIVSRPVQPTAPVGVYDRVPAMTRHAADSRFRAFSLYEGAHQYLYADPRVDIYEWAMESGVNAAWYPYPNVHILYQNGIKMLKYNIWMQNIYSGDETAKKNFLNAIGVKWIVAGEQWPNILWGGAKREARVVTRPAAIPRFALYQDWHPVASDGEALRYLQLVPNLQLHARPAIEETSLLRGRGTSSTLPPRTMQSFSGSLTVTKESNSRLEFKTNGEKTQLLVVSDAWYPGWSATIDGKETPIHRVNYMFRGVFVPPGAHEVTFSFWPVKLGWYCAASCAGLLMALSLLVSCWRDYKKYAKPVS